VIAVFEANGHIAAFIWLRRLPTWSDTFDLMQRRTGELAGHWVPQTILDLLFGRQHNRSIESPGFPLITAPPALMIRTIRAGPATTFMSAAKLLIMRAAAARAR
jgi:hypothetical protein